MNRTWHLIRKDLHRLRLPLALWTLAFVVRIFLCDDLLRVGSDEIRDFSQRGLLIIVVTVVTAFVNYLLAAGLVFEDPVAGTRMFWASRPISGARLLMAKWVVAALAFILWPVLIHLGWGLWQGIALASLVQPLQQTALLHASFTLVALALAAVTAQPARLLIWTMVGLVAIPVVLATSSSAWPRTLPPSVGWTRDAICLMLLLAGGVAVIVSQYLTRRTIQSVILGAVALAGAAAIRYGWRWDLTMAARSEAVASSELFAGAERTAARSAWIQSNGEKVWLTVLLEEPVAGRPTTERRGQAQMELTWSDDAVRRKGWVSLTSGFGSGIRRLLGLPEQQEVDAETVRYLSSLRRDNEDDFDPERIIPAWDFAGPDRMRFEIDAELADRIRKQPPQCRVLIEAKALRPELIGEIPLEPHAVLAAKGFRVSVQETRVQPRTAPRDNRPTHRSFLTFAQPTAEAEGRLILRVIDRTSGQMRAGSDTGYSSLLGPEFGLPSGYGLRWMDFPAPWVWRTDRWMKTSDWDTNLTVAAIAMRPAGTFKQALVIERLVVDPLPQR